MTDFQQAMAVLAVVVVIFAFAMLGQRRRPTVLGTPKDRLDVIDEQILELRGELKETDTIARATKHDVGNIRSMMQALPSKDAVHRLEVELAELKGELKLNNAETLATSRAVERIENHLLAVEAARKSLT